MFLVVLDLLSCFCMDTQTFIGGGIFLVNGQINSNFVVSLSGHVCFSANCSSFLCAFNALSHVATSQ